MDANFSLIGVCKLEYSSASLIEYISHIEFLMS